MKSIKLAHWLLICFAAAVALAGCATFTGEIPVDLDVPETVYISPANADGIQDELNIAVELPEMANLLVQGYRFAVADADGAEVYVVSDEVPDRPRRQSLDIPNQLQWSGIDSSGALVEDGEYSYTVEAWDRADNRGQTRPRYVVVDNTAPSVEVYTPFPLFSPNGDGRLDSIQIRQANSTLEDEWYGQILDESGKAVRDISWRGLAADFSWDGKTTTGTTSADGTYTYRVTSTDRAGNSLTIDLSGLTIDTEPTTVSLSVDMDAFSPNDDGIQDLMLFGPGLTISRNIESWHLDVYSALGRVRSVARGETAVPESIPFDGRTESGVLLPDGEYRGVLTVNYRNGDESQGASRLFLIDTQRPVAAVNTPYVLFSPDGDGRRDNVEVRQSSGTEDRWDGVILSPTGRPVRSYSWSGRAVPFVWDGTDATGSVVADGVYSYELRSTDSAGNSSVVTLSELTVDNRATSVSVLTSVTSFSPNGDGIQDVAGFDISASFPAAINEWNLELLTTSGTPVQTLGGRGRIPSRIVWDGRNASGQVVDGRYSARLTVEYRKGNISAASTPAPVRVDTTAPTVSVRSVPALFSPDNDGENDLLTITLSVTDLSPIVSWSASVLDRQGNPFKTFSGTGSPPRQLTWNGLSDSGELVQSAEDYSLTVMARDSAWNEGRGQHTIPVDILVLREGDRLRIVISSIYFEPFTANYLSVDPDQAESNLRTLDRLAEILKKFGQYQIRLEGHAVRVYWNNPARLEVEEREVLLPLSTERADVIRQALIERGVVASRMTTQGFGGTKPVVPHSDEQNRWKNRRVEFLLVRPNQGSRRIR